MYLVTGKLVYILQILAYEFEEQKKELYRQS